MSNIYDMSGKKKVIIQETLNVSYKEIMTLIIKHATEEGCKNIFTVGGVDMCPSEVLGEIINKQKEDDDCNYNGIGCTKCWTNAINLLKEKEKSEMGENLKIIRFNDDNHAERIWANGKFIGTAADMDNVFLKFWEVCKEKQWNGVESTSIWVCDDFDDVDEDTVEEIWDWFNEVEEMTSSQRLAIESKNWEWLIDLI